MGECDWEALISTLYDAKPEEEARAHRYLEQLQQEVDECDEPPLTCSPNELRDILVAASSGKAGGQDGVPSQALKALPFAKIVELAHRSLS